MEYFSNSSKGWRITFWLNGVETAHEIINSDRWTALVASTSLNKFPSFGKATSGRIGLQDWEKGITLRNIGESLKFGENFPLKLVKVF